MSLLIALISTLLSIILLLFTQNYFIKKNIFDKINSRSSHVVRATRNGGLSIFLNMFFLSVFLYILGTEVFDYSLIIPLSILFIVGLYDDIYSVDYKLKFIFQIIVAKILIDNGFVIDNLHGTLGIFNIGRIPAQLVTIFIVLAIINAINFIDGIDGLASSICILFIIFFEFFISSQSPFSYLSLIIVTSLVPLIIFNLRKNKKIFLGDTGSLFLGGVVSIYILFILSSGYLIKESFDLNKILFVFSIIIYPIIDITRVVLIRLKNKKSPFTADKNHIHHKLLKIFKSHIKVTAIITLFTLSFVVLIQLLNNL